MRGQFADLQRPVSCESLEFLRAMFRLSFKPGATRLA